ncbi:unnamed protein product [Boreogadus saida]
MFSSVPAPATPARAMSPEQQQRADSPGPSFVSMERSKKKKRKMEITNLLRKVSHRPICVSLKSDRSMGQPVTLKDGNQSIGERSTVLVSATFKTQREQTDQKLRKSDTSDLSETV